MRRYPIIIRWYCFAITTLIFSNLCVGQSSVDQLFIGYDSLTIDIISEKENSTSGDIEIVSVQEWSRLLVTLNSSLSSLLIQRPDSVLESYEHHALILEALIGTITPENQHEIHPKLISVIVKMDHYKTAYLINKILEKVDNKADYTITLVSQLPDTIRDARDSILLHSERLIRDPIIDTISLKSDSIVSQIAALTNYGSFFIGPSLYVENTYGFNFFIDDTTMEELIGPWPDKVSLMPEFLFFSTGIERRMGGALSVGYSLLGSKVIPQLMIQFLDDKRSLEGASSNNFGPGFGFLFKNREWMAGFSYSSVSGGGIKLLIGL